PPAGRGPRARGRGPRRGVARDPPHGAALRPAAPPRGAGPPRPRAPGRRRGRGRPGGRGGAAARRGGAGGGGRGGRPRPRAGPGVGRVELADGTVLPGFVAAAGGDDGPDLTPWGGWRAWRLAGAPL